jgi:segregation and condensation protein B
MDLKFILESILFSAQQPLAPRELRDLLVTAADHDESGGARAFKKTPVENITAALEELARDHEAAARSYRLVCVAGAWQFASQPEFAPWLKALVGHRNRPPRLSAPALETLAIIAYRQPITRAEIEQVRGVAVDGVMQTLLERALVEQKGRADVVGRPNTYGTTPAFLEYFGLKELDDLPAADELRRIPVTKPDSLLTVDPGLATVPPEQLSLQDGNDHSSSAPVANSPSASGETPSAVADAAPAAVVTDEPAPTPRRRKTPQANVEVAQGAVQVSPAGSELPPTTGTASSAAVEASASSADSTETTSAEPPAKNRLARRKKDTGSDN